VDWLAHNWAFVAVAAIAAALLALFALARPGKGARAAGAEARTTAPAPDVRPDPAPPGALPSTPRQTRAPERARAPDARPDEDRAVRVFVSSTFLDMQRERDVLVRQTFPALRARFRARGVEVLEVDLRWGVTQEQAESGQALSICLAEIDRCRPFFIGLIGERYGWVPPEDTFTADFEAAFPAVAGAKGASITELEVRHGVLAADRRTAANAIFFFRDPAWVDTLPPEERARYVPDNAALRARHEQFKALIEQSGATVISYRTPEEIGAAVELALGRTFEARFADASAPDAFAQGERLHEAYARERRGLHIGAEPYLAALDRWEAEPGDPPLVVIGASGGGKSTLIANWLSAYRSAKPHEIVFEHYLGASPDSADPRLHKRRLMEHLNRATGETAALPDSDAELMDIAAAFAQRLAEAGLFAEQHNIDIVIALDGLDKLASEQNLRWLPRILPARVRLLASSLESEALRAAEERGWRTLEIKPLTPAERTLFIERLIGAWGRRLSSDRIARIGAHALAGVPLFLRTVLEELRYSAINERLDARIDFYLGANDMPGLFARVLERLEDDSPFVAKALAPVWASRAGLEESDIIAVSGAQPLNWAVIRNGLGDALRDQGGRIAFSHDFLRNAVAARYLAAPEADRRAHLLLADHFERGPRDPRQAEELPFQLRAAQAWERLRDLLVDLDRLKILRARGDVELLGYWLPLAERGCDPETLLCAAMERRLKRAPSLDRAP
jgi:nephrocystin-3